VQYEPTAPRVQSILGTPQRQDWQKNKKKNQQQKKEEESAAAMDSTNPIQCPSAIKSK
jgi:hypothetical protein